MSNSIEQPIKPKEKVIISRRDEECIAGELYTVFHTIMSIIAIYLSFRCNKKFDLGSFISAFCCPYLYIIYSVATKGTCGIIPYESTSK